MTLWSDSNPCSIDRETNPDGALNTHAAKDVCGNFDIILDPFPTSHQASFSIFVVVVVVVDVLFCLFITLHMLCDVFYLVTMGVGCCACAVPVL